MQDDFAAVDIPAGPNPRADALFAAVYDELRGLAQRQFSRERAGHTLRPTALVHEAYLKIARQPGIAWNDDAHFVALAARAMRQVLIDHSRRRGAARRPQQRVSTDPDSLLVTEDVTVSDFVAIDEALERLAQRPPNGARQARLVEWVWLGGMSFTDAARELGIDRRTAHRDWAFARTWLARELKGE